jgi:phosphopantothenoylcysteine decarboxylase/phosphopantothenate--cysteine ligase
VSGPPTGARGPVPGMRGPVPDPGGRLGGRFIGLGVTGSIAAYKAVELLRLLRAEGAEVQCILSNGASRFVAPLALEALSRRRVDADVLALLPDGRIGHIIVADAADAIVVAPATAAWMAAMASGLASDTVTATCLATSAPIVVAPAMDGDMWAHPATQANAARLRDGFGYAIVGPDVGPLASGQAGPGRLAPLPEIVDAIVAAVAGRPVRAPDPSALPPTIGDMHGADLLGRRLVVSAGGTAEPIDPVRYIGNRSSGRMGFAVAEAARDRGADVTVVAGMTSVPPPAGIRVVRAETADAMRRAIVDLLEPPDGGSGGAPGFDALVMAAAVADFRPRTVAGGKLERAAGMTLELEPTPDVLAEVAALARAAADRAAGAGIPGGATTAADLADAARALRPVLVGFAAETGSLDRAPAKLRRKGVDLLVANDVAEPGSGFGTETNHVSILAADGSRDDLPLLPKREVADRILDAVRTLLDARGGSGQTGMGPADAGEHEGGDGS